MKTWFIETGCVKTSYVSWTEAMNVWKTTTSGYLCRGNGTLLDCK